MPHLDRRGFLIAASGLTLMVGAPALAAEPGVEALGFGPDPLQVCDLYPGPDGSPVLLFVHGGGWAHGERTGVHALPDYARRHGLALASTGYRLAPQVTARQSAEDVAAAVAAVRRARPAAPVILMGHSAGAHLAALIATDPAYLAAHGLTPADLAGVILLDGAGYDATVPRGGRGPLNRALERLYDQAFGAEREALSPTLRVRDGAALP
ncbi:alpha/beta hydrolase, partial [Brevundimonas sp.]|uniref:alpha/beta hydrolase n=1 Tax=Brevundimonas sp. TaxID=1871086 RepID=UPI003D6D7C32